MMNVLILSCNTGEGHNYAGKALKECILSHGDNAELVDIMPVSYTHLDVYKRQIQSLCIQCLNVFHFLSS